MITINDEKRLIVKAVNLMYGNMNASHGNTLIVDDKENIFQWNGGDSSKYSGEFDTLCTIEEFNQCVKEMSLNKWWQSGFGIYSIHTKQLLTKENSDYSYYEKESEMSEEKSKMKVEYVKVHFSKLSDAFKEHEESPLYICDRGEYHKANGRWIYDIVEAGEWFSLYRKVETEITWQDELDSFLAGSEIAAYSINDNGGVKLTGWLNSKQFIEMCHLVSSMNK